MKLNNTVLEILYNITKESIDSLEKCIEEAKKSGDVDYPNSESSGFDSGKLETLYEYLHVIKRIDDVYLPPPPENEKLYSMDLMLGNKKWPINLPVINPEIQKSLEEFHQQNGNMTLGMILEKDAIKAVTNENI